MRHIGRKGLATALALFALVGTTACSSDDDDAAPADPENESAETTAAPDGDGAALTGCGDGVDYDPEATFTYAWSGDVSSFDPDRVTSDTSELYLPPIYDTLIYVTPDGEYQGQLAESFELVDDNMALELTLIDGWTFHDGTPFDAEAVKLNLDRHRTLDGGYNVPDLAGVTDVQVVDDSTVRIVTKDGAAGLVAVLARTAGMMMSPAVFDDPAQALMPTGGSGAFRLVEYRQGDRAIYEAVEDYWDPTNQCVAGLVITALGDDSARLNAVLTGTADATFLRPGMFEQAENAAGVEVLRSTSGGALFLIDFNTQLGELGDKKVRQALNYGIDRDAINQVFGGFCAPTSVVLPSNSWAVPEGAVDHYTHDPERAKELLADAGLADGFSLRLGSINTDTYVQVAEVVQQNLAEIGVDVQIEPAPANRVRELFAIERSLPALVTVKLADPDPSITVADHYLPGGFHNPGGLENPELTELATQGLRGTEEERTDVYHEIIDLAVEEAFSMPVCSQETRQATRDRVQGYAIPAPGSGTNWRGVSIEG